MFSPAGFVLVGLLFLFPFVGISCSAPELGSVDAGFTGFDLAVDANPSYQVDSPVADMVARDQVAMPTPGVPGLAIGVLVVLAVGVACALLARPSTRLLAAAAAAVLAVVLLVVTQVVAESNLVTAIVDNARLLQVSVPQNLDPVANEGYVEDVVSSRVGFWLALVALVALASGDLVAGIRSRESRAAGGAHPRPRSR
ncbi:MAG: hypothetical protein GEV28_38925 [Actinophytocola sp.]|uniref:hypothetical protein n=1 Tax=Actinophytocola sp. TaxID=1872138 RepID=UPI0013270FB0|nr:hypothetical protein [Actinophytocola sp.]MPZ86027.1 hypothetical protein [Actinophytocola sp.]